MVSERLIRSYLTAAALAGFLILMATRDGAVANVAPELPPYAIYACPDAYAALTVARESRSTGDDLVSLYENVESATKIVRLRGTEAACQNAKPGHT